MLMASCFGGIDDHSEFQMLSTKNKINNNKKKKGIPNACQSSSFEFHKLLVW